MSKSNACEADIVAFVFNAVAPSWDGATTLYVSLHSSDPGEGGSQDTGELTYTGYARVAVSRDSGGWTCTGGQAANAAEILFGECSGAAGETVTHAAVGTAASGAGTILYVGAVSGSVTIAAGMQPRFPAGTLVVTED